MAEPFRLPWGMGRLEEAPNSQVGEWDPQEGWFRFRPTYRRVAEPPPPPTPPLLPGGMRLPFGFPGQLAPHEGTYEGFWDPQARDVRYRQAYQFVRDPVFQSQNLPGARPMMPPPGPGFFSRMFGQPEFYQGGG